MKIHPKSTPGARPRKNKKNNEKKEAWASVRLIQIGPFLVQNCIKKSWKNRCRKSMPKCSPKGRKGVENGTKMGPKTMKKSMQKSIPKTDRKNIEKTWKMEAPNLENHCFSLGKTMIFKVRRLHFSYFFDVFSIRFRHWFLHWFFHGFGTQFGSIFEPLPTL